MCAHLDNLILANREIKGAVPVPRTIELLSIQEITRVVHTQDVSILRCNKALARLGNHVDLQIISMNSG